MNMQLNTVVTFYVHVYSEIFPGRSTTNYITVICFNVRMVYIHVFIHLVMTLCVGKRRMCKIAVEHGQYIKMSEIQRHYLQHSRRHIYLNYLNVCQVWSFLSG